MDKLDVCHIHTCTAISRSCIYYILATVQLTVYPWSIFGPPGAPSQCSKPRLLYLSKGLQSTQAMLRRGTLERANTSLKGVEGKNVIFRPAAPCALLCQCWPGFEQARELLNQRLDGRVLRTRGGSKYLLGQHWILMKCQKGMLRNDLPEKTTANIGSANTWPPSQPNYQVYSTWAEKQHGASKDRCHMARSKTHQHCRHSPRWAQKFYNQFSLISSDFYLQHIIL